MSQTIFIDTNRLPRQAMSGGGEMAEILNDRLAGAKNVTGALRWLKGGERFEAAALDRHQLLYLMEGSATLTLGGKAHQVAKGMGVYLAPAEGATVEGAAGSTVKLFHLVVEHVPG